MKRWIGILLCLVLIFAMVITAQKASLAVISLPE